MRAMKNRSMVMGLMFVFLLGVVGLAFGIDVPAEFEDQELITGLEEPANMEFSPDGRLFIAERVQGTLRVATQSGGAWTLLPDPFYTFDIPTDGNGTPERHRSAGLLDIAFDPNFATNGYVYVFYMKDQPRHNRVVRITASALDPNRADPSSEVLLLDLPFNGSESSGSHNGGAVEFGSDGKLYIATGNGWTGGDSVQTLQTYTGKIFRINPDGSIPTDNPFYGQLSGDLRAIYALGARNPYTMSLHPVTGVLYVNDVVGSDKADLFRLTAGANFGHQGYGGIGVSIQEWADLGGPGMVLTGGDWYPDQGTFPPEFRGSYFCTLWGGNSEPRGRIQVVDSESNNSVSTFATDVYDVTTSCSGALTVKPVSMRVGPDGNLYYLLTHYETNCGSVHSIRWINAITLAAPSISEGGWFENSTFVTLATASASQPGLEIRYTVDGSEPTESSQLYSTPFEVTQTTTVRARTVLPGVTQSEVSEDVFVVDDLRSPAVSPAVGPGLLYEYYEGTWVEIPDLSGLTPTTEGMVDGITLSVRERDDEFALRFFGFVEVPTDGVYTFETTSDDGSRLSIGDWTVVRNDHLGNLQLASGTVGLQAGLHPISVEYFDHSGLEFLQVRYSGPGVALQAIPMSAFSRPGNQPPTADAGPDRVAFVNTFVELNGDGSSDRDNGPFSLTASWEQVSGPPTMLQSSSEVTAYFMPDEVGDYLFELTVFDGEFSATDQVSVEVMAPSTGLIAHWRLDETDGTDAEDWIGGQNGSFVGNPDWRPTGGRIGGALQFDGSNDGLSLGTLTGAGGSGLSIALWFRADDFGQSDGRLISRAVGTQEQDHSWMVSTVDQTALRFRLKTSGVTTTLATATGEIAEDQWYHVVAVYDGSRMVIYRDGEQSAERAKSGPIDANPNVVAALGNQPVGAGSRPFDGRIDDVRIYNRALSPLEVAQLAGCGVSFTDCNGNGTDDNCDIADGVSDDCNENNVPDECDIAEGTSDDANGDDIPDECGLVLFRRADGNADGFLDITDAVLILQFLFQNGTVPCLTAIDADADGLLNLADVTKITFHLFSGGPPPAAPFPACGPLSTDDPFGCDSYPGCP